MPLSKKLRAEIYRMDNDPLHHHGWGGKPPVDEDYYFYLLSQDPRRYREIEEDPVVTATLQKRKLAVVSRETEYKGDTEAVELVKQVMSLFPLDRVCSDLLDATLKGFAAFIINWKVCPTTGLIYPCPQFLPQHRINFKIAKKNTKGIATHNGYEVRLLSRGGTLDGTPIPQKRVIVFSVYHGGKNFESPQGRGIGGFLWSLAAWRKEFMKFSLIYGDGYASPVPVAESEDVLPDSELDDLDESLEKLTQGAHVILPPRTKLDYMEPGTSGGEFYLRMYQALGHEISKIVLGETGSTDQQGDGGSRARDAVGNEVRLELAQADADLLHAALQPLLNWIIELNAPNLTPPTSRRVFPSDEKKKAEIEKTREEALKTRTASYQQLLEMGFTPSQEIIERDFPGWSFTEKKETTGNQSYKEKQERFIPLGGEIPAEEYGELFEITEEWIEADAQEWKSQLEPNERRLRELL